MNRVSLIRLAGVVILMAVGLAASARAFESEIDGGDGGGYFRVTCEGFVIGFEGRTGAYIDNFRLVCGAWDPVARRMQNRGPMQIQVGTSGGGGPSQAYCPDGFAINSIEFKNTFRGSDAHADFVHHINFVCVSLIGPDTIAQTYGPTTPIVPPSMGPFAIGHLIEYVYPQRCPPGEFMTGFQGRSGLYVDALGLICGPLPAAPAPQITAVTPQTTAAQNVQTITPGSIQSKLGALGYGPATSAPAPVPPVPPVAPGGKSDETPTGSKIASGQSLGFTGTWNTKTDKNWTYLITFIQDGQNVTGTYVAQNGDKGKIKGTVNDQVLQFNWEQDGGFTGTGQFALAADGNSFSGIYQGNPHAGLDPAYRQGSWSGTRR